MTYHFPDACALHRIEPRPAHDASRLLLTPLPFQFQTRARTRAFGAKHSNPHVSFALVARDSVGNDDAQPGRACKDDEIAALACEEPGEVQGIKAKVGQEGVREEKARDTCAAGRIQAEEPGKSARANAAHQQGPP